MVRNNLQMKNNQFRSNAISRRAVGQTEARSCQSAPLLPKQRVRTAEHGGRGMERSLGGGEGGEGQRKRKEPGYKDDGEAGEGGAADSLQ